MRRGTGAGVRGDGRGKLCMLAECPSYVPYPQLLKSPTLTRFGDVEPRNPVGGCGEEAAAKSARLIAYIPTSLLGAHRCVYVAVLFVFYLIQ